LETIEELTAFIQRIGQERSRGRLQARGEARALIRHNGQLPEGAPPFAPTIDIELAEVGFSLLRASLALREAGGDPAIWRRGFVRAGNTFEALVQNGASDDAARGFNRLMGASSYHLAGYSALAFSLMSQGTAQANFAPVEEAIVSLMLRDLDGLSRRARAWLLNPANGDDELTRRLEAEEIDPDDVVTSVVTSTVYRALAFFQFALQTGEVVLVNEARVLLQQAWSISKNANAVSLWWITRIGLNLINDLWANSLHEILPKEGPVGAQAYARLRSMFVGELFARKTSELELWPSQLEAALRSTDTSDDLVVALPTSAGKTPIAEITALMALSCGQRVLIVTPLRALSAQTERSFRRTFSPLGFAISSLYGAGGMAGSDEDALRTQDIVIATPEKLDFALRNDPHIINNIGLIVLDEGHLIGPSDREIRYENLVQRLLRRADSATRRVVCLSAILPEGEQLDDLTAWIRSDAPGAPIQSNWRPTRQRFGTLIWRGTSAQLNFNLEADAPYIRFFIRQRAAIRPRRTAFPRDNKELTLAAAWQFSTSGKRTLIFCTQRDSVEGYAETVVELNQRGYLPSLLNDLAKVERAVSVGREWLGAQHPAVRCLLLGVAIHHARLANPFLREVEELLGSGVLQVVIASPTLAQGLNLNAAVLLVPSIHRAGVPITAEEFANVAGRAGRAFVDLEGLIVRVMYAPERWQMSQWTTLVNSARARSLASGIIAVVNEVMKRLARTGVFGRHDAMNYLANSQEAWFPEDTAQDEETIESLIERLDTTVLGLVEALDANSADLPALLDSALTGSLWARQVGRLAVEAKQHQLWIMEARARLIWNKSSTRQRRSQFAMGVGLESGLALDAIAADVTTLLDAAEEASLQGNVAHLSRALVAMAEQLLQIPPFVPDVQLPDNWRDVLAAWLGGADVAQIGLDNMRVIEEVFTYRLTWAIEAIRMRRRSEGGSSDYVEGGAAACLETGLPQRMMAMLVRAGLPSRAAAIAAVQQTRPNFITFEEMKEWLGSENINALSATPNWPTPDTEIIWRRFREDALAAPIRRWTEEEWGFRAQLPERINAGQPGRLFVDQETDAVSIVTPDYREITGIQQRISAQSPSLLRVDWAADRQSATIKRMGQGRARWLQGQQ
jgi:replicative superfamily II helicase